MIEPVVEIRSIQHREVSLFSWLQRTDGVLEPDRPRRIDGGTLERLRRCHPQQGTGER